jgi:hypothetical protein
VPLPPCVLCSLRELLRPLGFEMTRGESLDTTSWIMDERKAAEAELRALLEEEPLVLERRKESLALVESIVAMIALQSVTGVASGFAGQLLYDKWKECTTRRQLHHLADRIPLAPDPTETVDEKVIRRDVVELLIHEGLSPAHAEYLTERVVTRVKSRLAKGRSSGGES